MRIAIDARIIATSTGRYVERLLHYLQEVDEHNDYVVLLDQKDMDFWQPTNPRFRKVALTIPNYTLREQVNYVFVLRRLKVDLVHFTMPQQPLLYRGTSITTIHDLTLLHFKNYEDNHRLMYDFKQFIFGVVVRFAAFKSGLILTPTNYVQRDIVKSLHANPAKIIVTLESSEAAEFGPAEPMQQFAGVDYVMYVGRMDPYKNIRRLILAHQQLIKARPDLHLLLPGAKDGNVGVLEQWCQEQKFKHIHFPGFISNGQLRWLYEHTKAYIFPSLSEGFGLPGLEAMTNGAPLVSSNATCLPEVYQDAAHYFDPENVEDIATKINDVLEDHVLREQLIKEGKRVVAQYSWNRMAQQTLAAYQQALRKKR